MSGTEEFETGSVKPPAGQAPPMLIDTDILTGIERGGVDAGVLADLLPDDVVPQESSD